MHESSAPKAEASLIRAVTIFRALRQHGPAFIATAGADTLVGALRAAPLPVDWASFATAARAPVPGGFGTVGYLGYEAGAWVDDLRTAGDGPVPPAWLGTCDAALVLRADAPPRVVGQPAAGAALLAVPTAPEPARAPEGGAPQWSSAERYRDAVRAVLGHLRAGDCYQVNVARSVTVPHPGDPLEVWRRLQAANPARRAMLLDTGAFTVLSNSPELLLGVRGRSLLSVPIKGTLPAERPPGTLLRSAKERAELTMIVDLVRADLGRVARPGSVRAGPRRVGRVGHLWHAMQRVYAELGDADGRPYDAVDALAALFPAGSVTGAPKLRASQVIAAQEGAPRGAYCGSMGWFGADGSASWNVAIRTVTFPEPGIAPSRAHLHVGAGIVWGSDPARECVETEWKAQQLLAALCA